MMVRESSAKFVTGIPISELSRGHCLIFLF